MKDHLLWIVLVWTGCDPVPLTFVCTDDAQCDRTVNGRCINGQCTFPSADCASGWRYDQTASEDANACVPPPPSNGDLTIYTSIDAAPVDLDHDHDHDQAAPLDLRPAPPDIATGPITYYGVFAAGAASVYIVGGSGTIMHSSDDGMTWSKVNPTAVTLYSVWGTSGSDVYTVGAGNHIYHTTARC
jgi:hypothetical protein